MPLVNLFIVADVDLGKTIGAGMVLLNWFTALHPENPGCLTLCTFRLLRELLPRSDEPAARCKFALLIVEEAHNGVLSGVDRHAAGSLLPDALRIL